MKTDYSSLLNPAQLQAVETSAQHVRIIAGAGSGKTRVLTYRIAYLIAERHVDPSRILAVTFTNKAAQEMKNRVVKLVPDCAPFLSVSTFHSFCARFLRREAYNFGFSSNFSILDEEDQEKIVKDIAVEQGLKKKDPLVKAALSYIRKKKERGIYPEDITITHEAFEGEKDCLKFYLEYESRKEKMVAFDFDDLILKTIFILEHFESASHRWRGRFTDVLVDEFQDTNDVEYKLLNLLLLPNTSLYVVGDPDQTIYTWRGANQKIILRFPTAFPDYEDVILNQNYRSTQNILNTANRLIDHNKQRVKKELFTEGEQGSDVVARRFETGNEEASFVAREVLSTAKKDGTANDPDFRGIAVLYRSSYLTRPFEQTFAAKHIPYRIYGGLRFYQRREVKDVLSYFRLLVNPKDNAAFERIVNVPRRGIGDATVEKIRRYALDRELGEYELIEHLEAHPDLDIPSRASNALLVLASQFSKVKESLAQGLEVYSSVLKRFIEDIGYYQYLADTEEAIDEDRAANVNALFDDINNFIQDNPESTFDEYLQNVAILTSQDDMNAGNYVTLMTIHVAKGLEFDHVYIIGANEGAFPSGRAVGEEGRDGMEEERRLCYVAMTRAKKDLTMTTNSDYSYQTDNHAVPSQFFEEAGLKIKGAYGNSPYGGHSYGSAWGRRDNEVRWGRNSFSSDEPRDFFSDGDHTDPFEAPKKQAPKTEAPNNGITDWAVGDRVRHDTFGEGIVIELISDKIIIVAFDVGKKTLMGSHPMLHRVSKVGGKA